ncbi:MAG: hypothetical protein M8357_15285, partial [Desulfobulbaceae bacterium]|nr:hypothetical protein [Desulfobulbaceae bacterium]
SPIIVFCMVNHKNDHTRVQKNERRVVNATPLQNDSRGIRRVNNTAGPHGVFASLRLPDFFAFMPFKGAPQSCREFSNSRSLCPEGVLKQ